MIEIFAVQMEERRLPGDLRREWLGHVSPERARRTARYVQWRDAQRSLIGDVLVRCVLCERLHLWNHQLRFDQNPFGKPHVRHGEGVRYNVSHSGSWVVCAVGRHEVGVDVQRVRPISLGISERYFSPAEHADLLARPEAERLACFYGLWVLKESYVKAIGRGLSVPLDDFTVRPGADGRAALRGGGPTDACSLVEVPFEDGYRMAVCVLGPWRGYTLRRWSVGQLRERMQQCAGELSADVRFPGGRRRAVSISGGR